MMPHSVNHLFTGFSQVSARIGPLAKEIGI